MKTKLLLLSLFTTVFATQIQAQNRTSVNAINAEISDNLDLRAVASIFGDSRDLQDFERRLNDPKLQISNLDLNNDDQVDYLRVIETVENRTHVIIIQSVLDQDVYQDVATIDVEKDRNNKIHVQVVGNVFMYGQNYIYEPVYYNTPVIYGSFWSNNYRPYYSTWNWNYYPSYYYAWNPFPVFRYRNNINICLTNNNYYNYVNYRRSNRAVILYSSRSSNGYERLNPSYSFSRRNANVANRYELVQGRNSRYENNYASRRGSSVRENSQNRINSSREITTQRNNSARDYSQDRASRSIESAPQKTESSRQYSYNRASRSTESTQRSNENARQHSQNRASRVLESAPQRTESTKDYSQNRASRSIDSAPQRTESTKDYSQNRESRSIDSAPQRTESAKDYSQNRASRSIDSTPERIQTQSRGNSERVATPQRMESRRESSTGRTENRRS